MTTRRYKIVADAIAEKIYSGEYRIGQRLPTERELAEQFETSRPMIREALIALELYGLISVRQGAGIYVQAWQNQPLRVNIFDRGVSPFELLDARRMIEGELVAAAAAIITDRELLALEQLIQKMKDSFNQLEKYEQYDRQFHVQIAKAARNTALTAVIDSLWALHTRGQLWSQLHRFIPSQKLHGDRLDEHRAIYDALQRRNPEDARRAMHEHLQRARETLMTAADRLQDHHAADDD